MRYQNLHSFLKHLQNASPEHLAQLYLVFAEDPFERAYLLNWIASYFKGSVKISFDQLFDEMRSLSFFSKEKMLLCNVQKEMTKEQLQTLSEMIPHFDGRLFLGYGFKNLNKATFEDQGVILDFLADRKFERDKRYQEYVIFHAKKSKTSFSHDALRLLCENHTDLAFLFSETDKLISYTAGRPKIEREDVLAISSFHVSSTVWQKADAFVWQRKILQKIDPQQFTLLLAAIRSQFQMGLKILKGPKDLSKIFPKLWPKTLEQKKREAQKFKEEYFRRGLLILFEAELSLKSTNRLSLEMLYAKTQPSPSSQPISR